KETGAVISFKKVDVTDTAALRQSIEEAMGKFGTIHALINNVANDKRTDIDELQEEEWHKSIDINLHPAFFAAQTAFPAMKKAGRGTIINFGSINSIIAPPNMVHYVTAKAGIEGMSKALAREYGPFGIRVNALLPGAIITEKQKELWYTSEAEKEWKKMVSIKETIYPVDVARLTLFLASDESTVITGQSIAICAGRT
ncbi:MAG: SDR family NAD(P)-dependent oxidoreductase, partial [Parvibaculales bacterium]